MANKKTTKKAAAKKSNPNPAPAPVDPNASLIEMMKGHDWYYDFSDSGSVFAAGTAVRERIDAALTALDPKVACDLWTLYAPKGMPCPIAVPLTVEQKLAAAEQKLAEAEAREATQHAELQRKLAEAEARIAALKNAAPTPEPIKAENPAYEDIKEMLLKHDWWFAVENKSPLSFQKGTEERAAFEKRLSEIPLADAQALWAKFANPEFACPVDPPAPPKTPRLKHMGRGIAKVGKGIGHFGAGVGIGVGRTAAAVGHSVARLFRRRTPASTPVT